MYDGINSDDAIANRGKWYDDNVLTIDHVTSLSRGQQIALCFLPALPGIISILSSYTIIQLIKKSKFNGGTYDRILFMFSLCDIVATCNYIVGPFLLREETSFRYWALGNDTTCTISGAVFHFGFSSICYYAVMSVYFLLTIRFGMTQRTMVRYVEPVMHTLAFGYPLMTAVIGIPLRQYNEMDLVPFCYMAPRREPCDFEDVINHHENMITRNATATAANNNMLPPYCIIRSDNGLFPWVTGGLYAALCLITILLSNILIFSHVFKTTYCNNRFNHGGVSEGQVQRVRQVAAQAFLYVAAFFTGFLGTYIVRMLDATETVHSSDEDKLFPLVAYSFHFFPLIGFFNFTTYIRPRYLRTRKRFPLETRYWTFKRTIHGKNITPTTRRRNDMAPVSTTQNQDSYLHT